MATTKKRKRYPAEFKAEAAKLVLEQGLSCAQASRDLGLAESVLGRWVQLASGTHGPAR
jgi:transposase